MSPGSPDISSFIFSGLSFNFTVVSSVSSSVLIEIRFSINLEPIPKIDKRI
ncbi:MAG TPA: hypothetical protein VFP49_11720 [Nitrososphaeraceae archaeon]|nr:hypothetical protein [Nitrososphaeraceae archaeon]